jgi:hypothetical protein
MIFILLPQISHFFAGIEGFRAGVTKNTILIIFLQIPSVKRLEKKTDGAGKSARSRTNFENLL